MTATSSDWKELRAEDLFDRLSVGRKYDQWSVQDTGSVPVLDQSPDGFFGYHDDDPGILATSDSPVVTFSNHRCYVRLMKRPFSVIQNVFPLRAKPGVDPYFMFHALRRSVPVTEYKGHWADFARMAVLLPPLPEQRAIAHILGTLDDKIELNRRQNRTLEGLARALFQSWFVDFDPVHAKAAGTPPPGLSPEIAALFPDSFEESELGLIPKGWRVGTLASVADIRGGKQLPTKACLPDGPHVVFGANGVMGYTTESTHKDFVIAFGRVGAYCGSVHWSLDGAWINNNASSVTPCKWPAFVLQTMLEIDFTPMRTGSAQPFIPNSALAAASIVLPEPKIADAYEAMAFVIRQKQDLLDADSRALAALRDALLPKLISGELRVPVADQAQGE